MKSIYASPLRVYLVLALLALVGVYCGINLPVSLFPNSSKPEIYVHIGYGSSTAEEFLNTYGSGLESQLRAINTRDVSVESIEATYNNGSVSYDVLFKWGVDPDQAIREVNSTVQAYGGRLPEEIRDSISVNTNNENSGFLAVSFFSQSRDLDDLYDILEPALTPHIAHVQDTDNARLHNPNSKEIRVELNASSLANLGLVPRDIELAILRALGSRGGGSLTVGPTQFAIQMPRSIQRFEEIMTIPLTTPAGAVVHVGDVAKVDFGPRSTETRIYKTSGTTSLILFATPKPGGNVKRMSEDILRAVTKVMPTLPKDIEYKVLVDPSEFIRNAIRNVYHEVGIGAFLAVVVLFLFIGSLKNVATAAIEIPLSMVLAFIMMRVAGMNINLISLGGLALSAGMNVDASVVVMENIFRHFEEYRGPLDFGSRLRVVTAAVKEVKLAVIGSTIASLVVFLPLAFTSDLSYAILGDLAKAVVFSHGFSAFVALILVPTVRLQLMGSEKGKSHKSPLEVQLRWLEEAYAKSLGWFLRRASIKWAAYCALALILAGLGWWVLPQLEREVIGTPDTDWMFMALSTEGNTLPRQMEVQAEEVERELLRQFGSEIQYTFTMIWHSNGAGVMSRLKDKSKMRDLWKRMEEHFSNTPVMKFNLNPWNPSELPIPDPPHFLIQVKGQDREVTRDVASDLLNTIDGAHIYQRVRSRPSLGADNDLVIKPRQEQWSMLASQGLRLSPSDLTDITRIALGGRRVGMLPVRGLLTDIVMRFPQGSIVTAEDIGAFPIGVGSRIVPLRAFADIAQQKAAPLIYRKDQRALIELFGRLSMDTKKQEAQKLEELRKVVDSWEETRRATGQKATSSTSVSFEEAGKDLTDALRQLGWAVGISVGLIFLTMVLQFGSIVESLLVLVSVPLGFIGVLLSLFIFKSTLSLNSILGVILLNGIAVANSIILVDFIKRCFAEGMAPEEAAVVAARKRLRPILITSLTTVLGMLPIALGLGEGGRILQPLGIAVSGGLWVSMSLTLFLVPSLQVAWLKFKTRHAKPNRSHRSSGTLTTAGATLTVALFASTALGADESKGSPEAFDGLLHNLVEQSFETKKARLNGNASRARNAPNRSNWWQPTLNASAKESRSKVDDQTGSTRAFGIDSTWNLFRSGADLAAREAADAEILAQQATEAAIELSTESKAAVLLLNLVRLRQETSLAQQQVNLRESALNMAAVRYRAGQSPVQEMQKVELDLELAKGVLRDKQLAATQAAESISASLAESNASGRQLLQSAAVADWPWKDAIQAMVKRLTDKPPPEATAVLSIRPDWQASQQKQEAAHLRARQAERNLMPSLDLLANWGVTRDNLTEQSQRGWAGSLALTVPIWDRGLVRSERDVNLVNEQLAQLEVEQLKVELPAVLRSAIASLRESVANAESRERILATSQKLHESALARFQRGLISANEFNDDERRLLDTMLGVVNSWAEAHRAYLEFCQAIGSRLARCRTQ